MLNLTWSLAYPVNGVLCCMACAEQYAEKQSLGVFVRANRPTHVNAADLCPRCGLAMLRDGIDDVAGRFAAAREPSHMSCLIGRLTTMFPDVDAKG